MPYHLIGRGLRYALRALFAIVTVLLLFESIVRTLGLYRPGMYLQADTNYEWVIPAGTDIVSGLEGLGHTHYIADGEIATPYNDGAEVLVFGDSHTEGRQVNDEDKFVTIAETILRRRGRAVNLRNLGRSGADFADYVYFVEQAWKRVPLPTAVVIQVDEEDFDWHAFDSSRVNYFAWGADGKLALVHHAPPADKWILRWWERIFLLYPLRERWKPPTSQAKTRPPSEADIERSVAAEARLMQQASGGIPLLIVRTSYMPYVEVPHTPPAITFDTLRKAEPWPIVDPAPDFVRLREQHHRDVRTFWNTEPQQSHFNTYGHAIIGKDLADGLDQLLFPQAVTRQ